MKITFLFGSGADTNCNSSLKSGADFTEAILTSKYKETRKNILGGAFANVTLLHKNSRKIYAQTIFYNQDIAKEVFDSDFVNKCVQYYRDEAPLEDKNFFHNSYKAIREKDEKLSECKDFYLKYMQFFDVLDEKFNALRFPDCDDNNNAKRVINTYWCVYLLMLDWLYKTEDDISSIEELLNILENEYKISSKNDSYYQNLKRIKNCNIVTTNYTNLAEKITEKKVVYLHGKMTWFEDLKHLTIYESCNKDKIIENIRYIIPFILIPSGVKPLVCTKQIQEFYKFIKMLNGEKAEKCNELCVIGYRFNSEDNHINSIIAEWLNKEGNHMTVFDYDDSISFSNYGWSDSFTEERINYDDESVFIKNNTVKISRIISEKKNFSKAFAEYVNKKCNLEE